MNNRLLAIGVVIIALTWLACTPGHAQPAPAALTEADITRDSACGAGGVGRIWAGDRREQIERRDPATGERVNADGYWSAGCRPPAPPPLPKACPGDGKPATWTVGDQTCTTARPRNTEPASARQQGLQHGRYQILRQWLGPMRGTLIERCTDGVRSVVSATCTPATECDTAWSKSDGGVTYIIDARPKTARIQVGAYAQAAGSDGTTLRVQCVAGEIQPAPQCLAGQTVVQRYSGGPIDPATGKHLGDIRLYRYDGQPVEPGKLVQLTQIEGRRRPDGSPRTLIARCSATGKLQ